MSFDWLCCTLIKSLFLLASTKKPVNSGNRKGSLQLKPDLAWMYTLLVLLYRECLVRRVHRPEAFAFGNYPLIERI